MVFPLLFSIASIAQVHQPADPSGHQVSFVEVEPGVKLEVLDWGGKGPWMVLLTGLGDNAHIFDDFAYQFTDRFHVIGITRRGFGKSSKPAGGYDISTRAKDDIAILDHLKIQNAVFIGHSVAGTELNKLGADYPARVNKLVYLDALDLGWRGFAKMPQPPGAPEPTDAELASLELFAASDVRESGFRRPLAAVANLVTTDASGKITGSTSPPEVSEKIIQGLEPARYDRIKAPTLALFNQPLAHYQMSYYPQLSAAKKKEYDRNLARISKWIASSIARFRKEVKGAKVIVLHDVNHYFYLLDEANVAKTLRNFLSK